MLRRGLLLLALLLVACTPSSRQAQAVVADTLAKATNAAVVDLVAAHNAEGETVIAGAETADEALRGLEAVRARWAPIWEAWDVWQAAHDAWVVGIEQGTGSLQFWAAMRAAYCELREVLRGRVELPDMPLASCGGAL